MVNGVLGGSCRLRRQDCMSRPSSCLYCAHGWKVAVMPASATDRGSQAVYMCRAAQTRDNCSSHRDISSSDRVQRSGYQTESVR